MDERMVEGHMGGWVDGWMMKEGLVKGWLMDGRMDEGILTM